MRRVPRLFALADRLEGRLEEATACGEKRTPSLLAKTFRCELVTTEAELAEAEGRSFESAEELLQRITSARTRPASSNGAKVRRKRARR